jgi:hypothetical protein
MTKLSWRTCYVACFFLLLGRAHAGTITLQFSGNVTQVPVDELFGDIVPGEAIQGSFSFDPSATDLLPADPTTGIYQWTSPFGMTATIGMHEFNAFGSLTIGVINSFVDQYLVLAMNAANDLTLELFMQDDTGTAFDNDHLPLALPDFASFGQKDFHLDASNDDGEVQVDGQFGVLPATAVPEPSSAILLFAAPAILWALCRRRRRNKCN